MDRYTAWLAPFGLIILGAVLVALIDAARMRRWRWVALIAVLPFVGAMAWWTAGRRAYQPHDLDEADSTAG